MRTRSLLAILIPTLVTCACGGGGGGGGGPVAGPPAQGFRVLLSDPRDGELFVQTDKVLEVTFSEPCLAGTVDEHSLLLSERVSGRSVSGTVEVSSGGRTASFAADRQLLWNTRYTLMVTSSVASQTGEVLGDDYSATFRTGISDDPPPEPPPAAPKGSFREVGDLNVGRSSHTSTLLLDGSVLVTGGFFNSSSVTASAEVYDPAEEGFRLLTDGLDRERAFHAAIRLRDGRVLITGGVTGASLTETDSVEIYDPDAESFTLGSRMVYPRAFHTMTMLSDGRVLVAGGTVPTPSGVFSSRKAEIFNPASGLFTEVPEMQVYRAAHTATALPDGTVLLAGGNSTDRRIEIFEPDTNRFDLPGTELRSARRGHTATVLADGDILIMGGGERTAELFLPSTRTVRWTPGYPVRDRKDHTADRLTEGYVLFAGGSYVIGGIPFFHRDTEIYDPWSSSFKPHEPQLAVPRTRHRSTELEPGVYLFTGGQNTDASRPELRSAELFELD